MILDFLSTKPIWSASFAVGTGVASGILTLLQVLTPIIGFSAALLGLGVALLTFLIKLREYREQTYVARRKKDDRDDRIKEDNRK